MELAGEPIPFLDRTDGGENYSCSVNGTLCYRQFRQTISRVGKFDRSGKKVDSIGPPGAYWSLQLSPDETRVVLEECRAGAEGDLWTLDLSRGVKTRITRPVPTVWNYSPHWYPDDSRIAFSSNRDKFSEESNFTHGNLYVIALAGKGDEAALLPGRALLPVLS